MTTTLIPEADTLTLTTEQEVAVEAILGWYSDPEGKRTFKLHGYAGTGKTTVLKEVVRRLRGIDTDMRLHFAAPTNKAAQVMRSKGLDGSTTLHTGGLIWQRRKSRRTGSTYFHPLPKGEAGLDEVDLLIVDEVSMVHSSVAARILYNPDPQDLFNDMATGGGKRENLRVLAVGDPAQLWPVPNRGEAAQPSPWAIEGNHNARLETIHRSAEDSPILKAATAIRGPEARDYGEMWRLLGMGDQPDMGALLSADQVIVQANETRWHIINLLRKAKGMPDGEPVQGDRLVMLENSSFGVKGDQFEVATVTRGTMPGCQQYGEFDYFRIGFTDGRKANVAVDALADYAGEGRGKNLSRKADAEAMTFADAITCHKAQGSEWDSVVILGDEPMSTRSPGWHYTAITRARKWAGVVSIKHLPSGWSLSEARVIRDEWWCAVNDADLPWTVQATACVIVEAIEDEDTIRVNVDPEMIAERIGKASSTVQNHMTQLRKAGYLKGKGALTMLHFPQGIKKPSILKQIHARMVRQSLAADVTPE